MTAVTAASNVTRDFHLKEELHNTVVQSLVTSFGLDFLLFEDKKGGDVATVHNVRQHQQGETDIHLAQHIKQEYADRGAYKPVKTDENGNTVFNSQGKAVKVDRYHSDAGYKQRGAEDKQSHQNGDLYDAYRDQAMTQNENRQLDHIISSHEVHNDAGRVLAGLDGVELANQSSNFQSTHSYVNNLKSAHSMDEFLGDVLPRTITSKKESIRAYQAKLADMPMDTAQQRHEKRKVEDKVRKEQEHLDVLESLDHEKMREADNHARKQYDQQINQQYYTSSKFLKSTAYASVSAGFKMGMRQALGLIFAEVWFELKEHLPFLFNEAKENFTLKGFLARLKQLATDIWQRIKVRFKAILVEFKDGAIAGVLSSLTTTVMNIFFTTQKAIGKLLREMWSSLVSAAKLIFFNPNKLSAGDLVREVTRILSTGVAVAMGVILNQHLASIMTFPFGSEIAAFVSAIATGLMTLGISYFLDHSALMQKVWNFLNKFKSQAKQTLEYFQKVNAELDRYLSELAAIEFNLNPCELRAFNDNLAAMNTEYEKGLVLKKEVERRNIDLPFEAGNLNSTRDWLASL
ncbi:ATPase [Photobacterium jeanii]|uniref:ATPase n=1 Tax=Photobacterium jeanii TaxID=858640 RepID=A0A178KMS8_9GAMM|nr:ATPase [Photobacterium jeanii]OAN17983.1 ATPase [Photobacterium jeanii]PST92347.1 ATPase [Photobacterium jeanii]